MPIKPLPLLAVIADYLGGWERIRCPHPGCDLSMRFKGVTTEARKKQIRAIMDDHVSGHTT